MEYKYLKWATEVREGLNAAAKAGTLTPEMLTEALYTIEDGGPGCIPDSIGAMWILEHPAEFAQAVGDVHAFLEANMDMGYDFIARVLQCITLLKYVPEAAREDFICRAFAKRGHIGRYFVRAMYELGFSREFIADLIILRLRAITPENLKCANTLDDFLGYAGAEHHEGSANAPWLVLGDRLMEALRICAEKSPARTLKDSSAFGLWLSPEEVKEIRVAAANRLENLAGPANVLMSLPVDTLLALIRRTKKVSGDDSNAAVVLAKLAMLQEEGFMAEIRPLLDQFYVFVLYRAVQLVAKECLSPALCAPLTAECERRLLAAGYLYGRIEEGTFLDRKSGRQRRQMQVKAGGMTYVPDRSSHRYFPQVGDQVVFKPGRALTPKVTAVIFVPVDPKKERD